MDKKEMKKTINREASDKTKGFRLQKLRAAIHMLKNMREKSFQYVVAGIEIHEDVFVYKESLGLSNEIFEEDKNYNKDTSFSFNSEPVVKSFASFMDIWIKNGAREGVEFVLYFTNRISKERFSKKDESQSFPALKEPILKLIKEKKWDEKGFLETCLALFKDGYSQQYINHSDTLGYVDMVEDMCVSTFKDFLNCVTIISEGGDEKELEQVLIDEIRLNASFDSSLLGREETIKSVILEVIEKRQGERGLFRRIITPSDIKCAFLEVRGNEVRFDDPAHEAMAEIKENVSDKRNLKEKLEIAKSFSKSKYSLLAVKVAVSKIEQKKMEHKKSVLSAKVRVFLKCEEVLLKARKEKGEEWTEEDIDNALADLLESSIETMKDSCQNYAYALKSESFIEGLVLDLFDGCFLSFEGESL